MCLSVVPGLVQREGTYVSRWTDMEVGAQTWFSRRPGLEVPSVTGLGGQGVAMVSRSSILPQSGAECAVVGGGGGVVGLVEKRRRCRLLRCWPGLYREDEVSHFLSFPRVGRISFGSTSSNFIEMKFFFESAIFIKDLLLGAPSILVRAVRLGPGVALLTLALGFVEATVKRVPRFGDTARDALEAVIHLTLLGYWGYPYALAVALAVALRKDKSRVAVACAVALLLLAPSGPSIEERSPSGTRASLATSEEGWNARINAPQMAAVSKVLLQRAAHVLDRLQGMRVRDAAVFDVDGDGELGQAELEALVDAALAMVEGGEGKVEAGAVLDAVMAALE